MNADKLNKLEDKLYSDAPLIGDRIRQQAAKQLAQAGTPGSIKLLAKALTFSTDQKVQIIIHDALKKIKRQDQNLINAVCESWAENRESELAKLIKSRAWIPSQPLQLRVLVALMIDWTGIIEQQDKSIILPLLNCLEDSEAFIANRAKEWALSLKDKLLQDEVCRLASEEKNEKALEIANQAGYNPEDRAQSALFCFVTEQWKKYKEIDPEYKYLQEIYDSADLELKQTIDTKGKEGKRIEWVWLVVGGKEGTRLSVLEDSDWEDIIKILSMGKYWEDMFELIMISPVFYSLSMLKKLKQKRWIPNDPDKRVFFNELYQLAQKCPKSPAKGKLVRCVHTLTGHTQAIESMVISSNGKLLATAGDELIRVWNLENGELITTLKGHLASVSSLAINEEGDLLVSASRDKTLYMWRLPSGQLIQTFSAHVMSAWCVDMTKDSITIASGSYQEVRLWQYPTGKLLHHLRGHKREVDCLCISHDDSLLASGGGSKDNSVRLWELPSGQLIKALEGHKEGITGLAISPDNTILASASRDATIQLWQLPTGDEITTLEGHSGAIRCLAINSEGTILATGSDDHTVKLWQLPKGKLLATLEGHTNAIWSLIISKDGDLLVTGSKDKTIRLWSLPTGDNLGVLTGHTKPIRCLKMTNDGQMLVSGSDDKTLRLWNWDLIRLFKTSIPLLNEDDRSWIQDVLENVDITENEKICLTLMNQLSENYVAKHSQELTDTDNENE